MDSSEDLPAGSLKFDNDHTVPHEISIEVLNVGTSKGERRDGHDTVTGTPDTAVPNEISLRQLSLNPDKHRPMNPCSSHESGMTFDSHSTTSTREDLGRTVFHPNSSSDETTGQILGGNVSDGGELSWQISTTDNLGPSFQ